MLDTGSGRYTRLTARDARQVWPLWSGDAQSIFYVSDRGGAENLWTRGTTPDARDRQISQNEWVVVESRRGRVLARAFVSHVVRPGQCFMPMHYAKVNRLTFPAFDPYSRQPSYKNCAVRLLRKSEVFDLE